MLIPMSRSLPRICRIHLRDQAESSRAQLSAAILATIAVPNSSTGQTRDDIGPLLSLLEGRRPVNPTKVGSNDLVGHVYISEGGSPMGTPLRPKCKTQSHSPLACRFHSRQVTDSRSCPSGRPITRPTFHTRARPSSSSTSAETSVTVVHT